MRGGTQTPKNEGRTTPAGAGSLDPIMEDFTIEGSPLEDEHPEADTHNTVEQSRQALCDDDFFTPLNIAINPETKRTNQEQTHGTTQQPS